MARKIRIAVVTSEFPISAEPYRGIAIYQTVLALQKLAQVEVFCPISRYPRWRSLQPRNFYFRRVPQDYSPPNVLAHYAEYTAFPLISRPLNGRACARRLLPIVEKFSPDRILSYWLYPEGYAAVGMGQQLGVPVVIGSRGFDLSRITDPFTYLMTKKAMQQSSLVLTVSEELRQRAIRMGIGSEKILMIHNGCDRKIFQVMDRQTVRSSLGIRPGARLVLYVGRLDRLKGVQELLEACMRLCRGNRDIELAYIGEGPIGPVLRAGCAQMNLMDRVRFLGTRTSPQIAEWLAAADVLCLPSYSEGCPNVVLEALACGRPVVATDVGGIPELVDSRCGVLVPPKDVVSLAAALAKSLDRSWDSGAIAASFGRSWEEVAEETYEACCAALPADTEAFCRRAGTAWIQWSGCSSRDS